MKAEEDAWRAQDCDEDGWCWENPLPRRLGARALWGTGSDDVWAFGPEAGMLHWDGKIWSRDSRAFRYPVSSPSWAIWGRSRRDVWAVGGGIWHWDGESWTRRPGLLHWPDCRFDMGAGDDGTVWVAGKRSISSWTGNDWKVQVDGVCHPKGFCHWSSVRSSSGGRVGHIDSYWDGTAFRKTRPSPVGRTFGGTRESAIWLTSGGCRSFLEKWDGNQWLRLNDEWRKVFGRDGETERYYASCYTHADEMMNALWGASDTDVWVVGRGGLILRWNGVQLTIFDSPTTADLIDVWGSGPNDVWASGRTVLLHWDGARWMAVTSMVADARLNDVWGTDASPGSPLVWAVGLGGTILRRERASWSAVPSGVAVDLWGVAGSGPNDVWVVGDRGTILHFDGQTVSLVPCPVTKDLYAVWARSAQDAWVVGNERTTLHWNGSIWSEEGRERAIEALPASPSGSDTRWFLASRDELMDKRRAFATKRPMGTALPFRATWASARGGVWAVGDEGTILAWHAAAARAGGEPPSRTGPRR